MILLIEHDCGVDGWDASQYPVAVYPDCETALEQLRLAGYTICEHGRYSHEKHEKRFCMGAISYSLSEPLSFGTYEFS